jgi:hypothetical protein
MVDFEEIFPVEKLGRKEESAFISQISIAPRRAID